MSDLKPRERKLLQTIAAQLQRQLRVVRTVRATDQAVLEWCVEQDLIASHAAQQPQFAYSQELLKGISTRLQQQQLAPLGTDLSGSSLAQAKQGQAEHKSVRSKPRAQRVLMARQQEILDVDQRSLDLDNYAALVVVENLDCFYQLQQFQLPSTPAPMLVVYRGDVAYSQGRAALLQRWRSSDKPLCYFGDLDAKGFHIAQQEGFSHIAVPELAWFCEHATAHAYPAKQQVFAEQLAGGGDLAGYHQLLQREQRAMLQQWLQDIPLHWARCR
ncbi:MULTISPECIES: Wadjet anti-phage system protein JetD domain-containing protein [Pseudidiomarina]|uniref:Uncharacterized protein DUF2220 n=2 Tax=Pseudidiomarina TaxID=2800384 RepID=A0A368ULW0_9GAMM|nr:MULTISPECIES: Wadjet anti-phage system protein JetD domain-containing protein [Pseudidiomarina]PWW07874.1 uncharacterized protein DUF2220 [Pseudidiomarina maritima]RBP86831.1 uncharacterized protein DUF2220 [Pseudidiomarina tainanensis]RCW29000.1 uncharacterized protein DUF2220 [Pseudidiomarina tainanensis]